MLTTLHHSSALQLSQPQQRWTYSIHQYGLCHALGGRYGLLSRLATSHELVLLNILTAAQLKDEPALVHRRCPLNPLLTATANEGIATDFAAAVAIELANAKFADDVQDSNGRDVAARFGRQVARQRHQAALRALDDLGFNSETLSRLSERQRQVEQDETQDPVEPTTQVSAALFAATARLAGRPENIEPLTAIGASFGAYIYLTDAYHDFARDMLRGEYNPLRRFGRRTAEALSLSQAGLQWLLRRFEMIQASVRDRVPKLHLYRHADLLATLLCDPMDKIVLDLSQRVHQPALTFRRWQWVDMLKAGLFMLPTAASDNSSSPGYCEDFLPEGCTQEREGLGGRSYYDFCGNTCSCIWNCLPSGGGCG